MATIDKLSFHSSVSPQPLPAEKNWKKTLTAALLALLLLPTGASAQAGLSGRIEILTKMPLLEQHPLFFGSTHPTLNSNFCPLRDNRFFLEKPRTCLPCNFIGSIEEAKEGMKSDRLSVVTSSILAFDKLIEEGCGLEEAEKAIVESMSDDHYLRSSASSYFLLYLMNLRKGFGAAAEVAGKNFQSTPMKMLSIGFSYLNFYLNPSFQNFKLHLYSLFKLFEWSTGEIELNRKNLNDLEKRAHSSMEKMRQRSELT